MGYTPPPPPPPRLNLDRFGMPRDFATYMWVTYHKRVDENDPARRAFLNRPQKVQAFALMSIEASEDTR